MTSDPTTSLQFGSHPLLPVGSTGPLLRDIYYLGHGASVGPVAPGMIMLTGTTGPARPIGPYCPPAAPQPRPVRADGGQCHPSACLQFELKRALRGAFALTIASDAGCVTYKFCSFLWPLQRKGFRTAYLSCKSGVCDGGLRICACQH